jgi:gas vesicle protein
MHIGKYESSENSNVGTAITFLLIGLGAGALVGLLFAPKSGKQLRRDIKRGYEDALDTVGDWADEAADRMKDCAREAGKSVREAASRGIDAAADLAEDLRDKAEPVRKAIHRD